MCNFRPTWITEINDHTWNTCKNILKMICTFHIYDHKYKRHLYPLFQKTFRDVFVQVIANFTKFQKRTHSEYFTKICRSVIKATLLRLLRLFYQVTISGWRLGWKTFITSINIKRLSLYFTAWTFFFIKWVSAFVKLHHYLQAFENCHLWKKKLSEEAWTVVS